MFKKLVIVCGVLVLFLAACGSDKESKPSAKGDETEATATVAVEKKATPTAVPTKVSGPVGGPDSLFQPLSLLSGPLFGGGGLDMEAAAQEVSPDLKAVLLTGDDLPDGFNSFGGGEFGFAFDTPEGHIEMAMRMFFEGDMMSGEFGAIVMPAVMAMPPGALEEFDAGLAELEGMNLSAEDLQEMMGQSGMQGMEFEEFQLLEVSGLGEGGIGMHMVMDIDPSAFGAGAQPGMEVFQSGIALDAYMFTRGDRMLMVMTMWPAGEPAPVDSLALAEIMDSRTQ